jgi:hypothetical protein
MEQVPVRAEGGRKCVYAFAITHLRFSVQEKQDRLSESQNRLTGLGVHTGRRNSGFAFAESHMRNQSVQSN